MKLIGNINFSNSDDYQGIYSSLLYNTFFAIFAKISLDTEKSDADTYYLKSIQLLILNYKGMINLGITRARFVPADDGGEIIVEVKALEGENSLEVPCDNTVAFAKKGKSFLYVSRRVAPIVEDPNNQGLKNSIFDTEFFYREGFILKPVTTIDGQSFDIAHTGKELILTKPDSWEETVESASGTSPMCPKGISAVH